jgi:hypothetical protein
MHPIWDMVVIPLSTNICRKLSSIVSVNTFHSFRGFSDAFLKSNENSKSFSLRITIIYGKKTKMYFYILLTGELDSRLGNFPPQCSSESCDEISLLPALSKSWVFTPTVIEHCSLFSLHSFIDTFLLSDCRNSDAF